MSEMFSRNIFLKYKCILRKDFFLNDVRTESDLRGAPTNPSYGSTFVVNQYFLPIPPLIIV